MSFVIITDSGSDLTYEYVLKNKIKMITLKYNIGDDTFDGYVEEKTDKSVREFYAKLRSKQQITTSCVNREQFENVFEKCALEGNDFIYIGFSSALSATSTIGAEVCKELQARYPERKIFSVDSLSASLGQGLIVDHCVRMRDDGVSIDDVYNWAENNKLKLLHWFTVDDLFFLKRGGRINAATAIAGTVLGVKPVLHMNDLGQLINIGKARGRKDALKNMVDRMEERMIEDKNQRVFIGHGDCIDDAKFVEKLIRERFGIKDITIGYVTAVIGAHSGPGTLALFHLGSYR